MQLTLLDHVALEGAGQGPDPNQLINTFVAPRKVEPCYIVGTKAGPYVAEHSYNLYARLGARMALIGLDARVEVSGSGLDCKHWH